MTADTAEREAFEKWWPTSIACRTGASESHAWGVWQAARASAPSGAPEGWVLVPRDATDEMIEAAWDSDAADYVGEHKRIHDLGEAWKAMLSAAPPPPAETKHPDDIAVENFAKVMSAKLASKRALGYRGWNDKGRCTADHLSNLLRKHVKKGDPVDVANFAMMLHQRGERIAILSTSDAFERGARAMRNEIANTYCKGGNSYVGDEIRAWPLPKEET